MKIPLQLKKEAYKLVLETNYGNRGQADGDTLMQYTGILGELLFANLMGISREEGSGFDDGVDFVINGVKIDVKTMLRANDWKTYYVNNLFASQVDSDLYLNDLYVFININKKNNTWEIIGWKTKDEVKRSPKFKKGEIRKKGKTEFTLRADNYEVTNLREFISPIVFRMYLDGLCCSNKVL